jgi:hypothetical protein
VLVSFVGGVSKDAKDTKDKNDRSVSAKRTYALIAVFVVKDI